MLRGPNWALPFHTSTYASNTTVGEALGEEENFKTNAIYFISTNLIPNEINCTVIEKENWYLCMQLTSFNVISLAMKHLFVQTLMPLGA